LAGEPKAVLLVLKVKLALINGDGRKGASMTANKMASPNDETHDNAPTRLRCIQQITAVDEEGLEIVRSVLDRLQPQARPQRKRRTSKERPDVGGVE
jgi:hypothetical protein